jgi:hypothetical protein
MKARFDNFMKAVRGWLWKYVGRDSTFYRMHGRLLREVELQQRANRKKKSKLRGLRLERRRLRGLSALNVVHIKFIYHLQRTHPELESEIMAHQNERFRTLHPNYFRN